ncbi:hypothetical protein C5167_046323 [Papaver somniferum]|uniref:ABC transporter domain-containing protein n=1 Tax=Papaver somniferum TaxID=3469 RepID=A0A4Y7LF17_PAPSO|nr:ABC transporter F family member 4-like [Papaver somniferum]RZC83537.1 hypothetical protein C5167_046323 [Papaver somniferum]
MESADEPKNHLPIIASKPKENVAARCESYIDESLLPPLNDDDYFSSEEDQDNVPVGKKCNRCPDLKPLEFSMSEKNLKKREMKEMQAIEAAYNAKQEALREDRDAFTVAIGNQVSVLDGEHNAYANVKDISVHNFSVSARGIVLLKDTSVTIAHGKKYGLVGPNGTGKSALMKLLAWRKIPVPKNIDVHLVEQEVVGDDRSALEVVVSANEELVKLREQVVGLLNLSVDGNVYDDIAGEKLAALYDRSRIIGAYTAEAQASKILAGLGFIKDMQMRATRSFSGRWRMRISLARALFVQPTLLLLDEPTNHLDLRAALWLEEYLCCWKNTLVIVSHDRDFLNTICGDIIHLHEQKLQLYRGNFDEFERLYEQRRREVNRISETHEKQVKAATRAGNMVQLEKANARVKILVRKEVSRGKVDEDSELLTNTPKKWTDYSVMFHFPGPTKLKAPLLQLINVHFSYPNRNDFRLSNVDAGIDMGTQAAIVGPNGAGKSALLNLLAGNLVPTSGEVRKSPKLRIGRYSQHFVDLLTMEETPVKYLLRLHSDQEGPSKEEAVCAKLGKFGLPRNNHYIPIVKLSGGQKSRVVFTSISMSKPHILLLDEPTNHLDMQSIDALANALNEFTGGVVLVTHDSRLISQVCNDEEDSEIWVVENGTVEAFPGTFDEYKKELQREIKDEADE